MMDILIATVTFAAGVVAGWLSLLIVQAVSYHKAHLEIMEENKNEDK